MLSPFLCMAVKKSTVRDASPMVILAPSLMVILAPSPMVILAPSLMVILAPSLMVILAPSLFVILAQARIQATLMLLFRDVDASHK